MQNTEVAGGVSTEVQKPEVARTEVQNPEVVGSVSTEVQKSEVASAGAEV